MLLARGPGPGPAIDHELVLLAEATLVATVAVLVANFFAPGLFDKQMWLLFAMGPALLSLSRARATAGRRATVARFAAAW